MSWIDAPLSSFQVKHGWTVAWNFIFHSDNPQRFCEWDGVYTSIKCFWIADFLSSILREAQNSSESVIYVIIELKIAKFQISLPHSEVGKSATST